MGCEACSNTFILSVDGKSCTANNNRFDSKCLLIEELQTQRCGRCYPHYELNSNSQCVKRQNEDFESYSKCLMCREDYYMNTTGACSLNVKKNDDDDDDDDKENVGIISIITLLLAFISLF